MAIEEFVESLQRASYQLSRPKIPVGSGYGSGFDRALMVESSDPWLSKNSVEGFEAADFEGWARSDREELEAGVEAFLAIAATKPAKKAEKNRARKHLEAVMELVGRPILREWLDAQRWMVDEARTVAEANGWYADEDEKTIEESLLGRYQAPRLRLKSIDREVVLNPICRFGSGRRGVVHLAVLPSFETAYFVTYKDRAWSISSRKGNAKGRPFTRETFFKTITQLPPH